MTVREAAHRLGISYNAVHQAIRRGTIAATMTRGGYIITPEEVARYRAVHLGQQGKVKS